MSQSNQNVENTYLNEVMQQQAVVERDLTPQHAAALPARGKYRKETVAPATKTWAKSDSIDMACAMELSEDEAAVSGHTAALDYRITGYWFWKTVVVPPNVYVVHTRRGQAEPLHVGLGLSFRYNPVTDAFLIIPAAVQTLLINARCICAERQGVLVQAYMQWVVDDVRTAYRKLDFSDPADRMRIVKVQLREQAEAAIKDKVATMSIDDILADKQPIIAELTQRLKAVAEGSTETGGGLGLKIVTVQIKEAVVSSTRVWENLQKPFRADREKLARMAELDAQQHISAAELANKQAREMAELAAQRKLAVARAETERERFDREQAEKVHRTQAEHEAARQAVALQTATEKARQEGELERAMHELEMQQRRLGQELEGIRRQMELAKTRAAAEQQETAATIERDNLLHQAQATRTERDLTLQRTRRQIENEVTAENVRAQLIDRLPEIAASLPKPNELHAIQVNGDGTTLAGLVASVLGVVGSLGKNGHAENGVVKE